MIGADIACNTFKTTPCIGVARIFLLTLPNVRKYVSRPLYSIYLDIQYKECSASQQPVIYQLQLKNRRFDLIGYKILSFVAFCLLCSSLSFTRGIWPPTANPWLTKFQCPRYDNGCSLLTIGLFRKFHCFKIN